MREAQPVLNHMTPLQAPLSTGNPYTSLVSNIAGDPSRIMGERIAAIGSSTESAVAAIPASTERTQIDEMLFDVGSSFKVRTALIAMHLERGTRDKFFAQIDALLDSDQWDAEDALPTLKSLDTYLRLQFALKIQRRPSLGSSFNGNLIAAWVMSEGTLTIECMPEDELKWTLVSKSEAGAGRSSLGRIREILSPYGVERWSRPAPGAHAD